MNSRFMPPCSSFAARVRQPGIMLGFSISGLRTKGEQIVPQHTMELTKRQHAWQRVRSQPLNQRRQRLVMPGLAQVQRCGYLVCRHAHLLAYKDCSDSAVVVATVPPNGAPYKDCSDSAVVVATVPPNGAPYKDCSDSAVVVATVPPNVAPYKDCSDSAVVVATVPPNVAPSSLLATVSSHISRS